MSLNRAVVALGAVAVVGVATLGFSIPFASSKGHPVPNASVTSGSTWDQFAPAKDCWNDGKPLTAKQQAACVAALNNQIKGNALPTVEAGSNGTLLLNLDKQGADKGWSAFTLGNTNGTALVSNTKEQAAGPIATSSLFTVDQTTGAVSTTAVVRMVAGDSSSVYGVWQFEVKQKTS
ncbi:hypothetical protein [Streptacidiphilus sp. EB129]|jgi:hypothetical protein|uniref:hypothetical protein n=1 Tax=Streptacidiphilus sp. EB129 TaxID=3156262 RepID=UPI003519CB70